MNNIESAGNNHRAELENDMTKKELDKIISPKESISHVSKTELIKDLISKTGLNLKAFAIDADIPYTTLRSILERGIENASVNNVLKICSTLDLTIEEIFNMSEVNKASDPLSDEQILLLKNFDNLNDLGKEEALKRIAEMNMVPYYTK